MADYLQKVINAQKLAKKNLPPKYNYFPLIDSCKKYFDQLTIFKIKADHALVRRFKEVPNRQYNDRFIIDYIKYIEQLCETKLVLKD